MCCQPRKLICFSSTAAQFQPTLSISFVARRNLAKFVRMQPRQESSTCAFVAPPVVINFHSLPRGNASITLNRNQIVYNSIKLCHVTTWLLSILGSKRNQASFHSRRRKSSSSKDTIKAITLQAFATHVLSFSFCHWRTYVFKRCPSTQSTSVYFPGNL